VEVAGLRKGRRGKHHELVQGIVRELDMLSAGSAMEIPLSDVGGIGLANLRSAVHRAATSHGLANFDPSAFLVAGVFAGVSMAQKQYPHFGQGADGFAKYYGGAFADQAIGNFMTEALFPIALRQDPRYFTKGRGGFWKRTGYAISREVVTRVDNCFMRP